MKKPLILHPFLFALFPILFLYSHNINQTSFSEILVPAGIVLVSMIVFFIISLLVVKSQYKAALLVSLAILLFFSFGHVHQAIKGLEIEGVRIGRPRNLLIVWSLFFLIGTYLIVKTRLSLVNHSKILNVVAFSLVAMQIVNIGIFKASADETLLENWDNAVTAEIDSSYIATPTKPRDIYYIILDEYASSGILDELYDFDNSEFTNYLEEKGFYVASESYSNYPMTFMSLASSLNMEFINFLEDTLGADSEDRTLPYELIKNNKVVNYLKAQDYKYIHVGSGWGATNDNEKADLVINAGSSTANEFTTVLVSSTLLGPFQDILMQSQARKVVLSLFSEYDEIKELEGPKFVFAHIICPHPPFLFDENGTPLELEDVLLSPGDAHSDKEKYLAQLKFINTKVQRLIDKILSDSEVKPIIILQSDHGTASTLGLNQENWYNPSKQMVRERLGILNAYYLPSIEADEILYDSITPVNSFRIVLNEYFGTDYELLEDKANFAGYLQPYNFMDVTDSLISE